MKNLLFSLILIYSSLNAYYEPDYDSYDFYDINEIIKIEKYKPKFTTVHADHHGNVYVNSDDGYHGHGHWDHYGNFYYNEWK